MGALEREIPRHDLIGYMKMPITLAEGVVCADAPTPIFPKPCNSPSSICYFYSVFPSRKVD